MPKVSILLTSYNHEKYIAESIESILNQTFKDFELIIVDDCSTDKSWKIINSYNDKRIKAIKNKKNTYCSYFYDAINSLKGEYIAIAHSDDKWDITKIKKQVGYLDSHEDIGACFTYVYLMDEKGNYSDKEILGIDNPFNVENRTRYEWIRTFYKSGNCLCHPSCMIRRSIQINENLTTIGLASCPDFFRWIKLCMNHNIYIYPENLTYLRLYSNGSNVSGINPHHLVRDEVDRFLSFDIIYKLSINDLFLIFPEAKKYLINGDIIKDFAISQILLNINRPSYKAIAIKKIYKLLNSNETKQKLKEMYNYTQKEFMQNYSTIDFFNTITPEMYLSTTLFSYTNQDICEPLITKKEFISLNKFNIKYNISEINTLKLRFDPDEGRYRSFSDIEAYCDGEKVEIFPADNYRITNKVIDFYTLDPKFIIKLNKKGQYLSIIGKTQIINHSKIQNYLEKKKWKFIKKLFRKITN